MDRDSEILQELKKKMEGAVSSLKHLFGGLRTGRASAALLDSVKVEAYGSSMPIGQVGSVSVSDAKMIVVQVWDKGLVPAVEKAIMNSGLGLTPNTDGQLVRLPIPDLTQDRRKELVKKANEYSEQAKVSIRNIRRNGIDSYKKQEKEKLISEDELKAYIEEVQKITDSYIEKVDAGLEAKSRDILSI
ncbi:ribosome recycling factor [Candidatus Bandiella euplotis]|uniref:Ribosome-recycling factor n=1 Tax=Candidatus Bandiella euplotis TaxID=1664265 RepID=A0ABZ0UNH4_9RICK|nr:ribosome recycling factor [Candidatus Bandiella woodruffii]WPX96253.1 Ribosome-recycling factor [Candidatus Bandiella woodruffii]